LGSRRIKRRVC